MIRIENDALGLYKKICEKILNLEKSKNIRLLLSKKAVSILNQMKKVHSDFLPKDPFLFFIDLASKNRSFNLQIQVVENETISKLFEIREHIERPKPRLVRS